MAELAVAAAVRPAGVAGEEHRYTAELDPHWSVGSKLNGGYLLAVLANAAVDVAGAGHPHPVAVAAQFVAAPGPGPAEIAVRLRRRGRTAAQLHAELRSGGTSCVEALLTCGRLPPAGPPYWSRVEPPELPPEEDCRPVPALDPRLPVPLFEAVSVLMDPVTAGFATGRPSGRGVMTAWLRIPPDRPDPAAVLVALDTLPPATFDLGLLAPWVPTLELTCHLHALPAAGPLRVRQRARLVAADRVDEESDVWDSTGALVGSASQLAAVRLPEVP
ncbi:MAG: thioesterase family protein [Mycobacteriales bacterium]